MKLFRYIKKAFANHWNLLGLFGGIGFAVLSGQPEVGLPLVAAAEVAWLGFVGTHPKFQRFVDMQDHSLAMARDAEASEIRMRRMLATLPRGAQMRFQELMSQCMELGQITRQFQSAQGSNNGLSLGNVQLDQLDKLMWLFLKLLYTEHSLNRFFETTTIEQIKRDLKDVSSRLDRETFSLH